ncbi:hypothetical protein N9X94_04320 [Planktomarina temperata]|nr:hypothetical protein [Planktomarina temperata]
MSDLRPIDCTACPIRHRAVCARCDAAELDQLAAIKTYRNFSAGAQIMQRGAPLEFVASVVTNVSINFSPCDVRSFLNNASVSGAIRNRFA